MSAAGHAAALAVDRSSCSPLSMVSDAVVAGGRFGATIVEVCCDAGFVMSVVAGNQHITARTQATSVKKTCC